MLTAGCDIHIFDVAATLLYCGCLFGSCDTKMWLTFELFYGHIFVQSFCIDSEFTGRHRLRQGKWYGEIRMINFVK